MRTCKRNMRRDHMNSASSRRSMDHGAIALVDPRIMVTAGYLAIAR